MVMDDLHLVGALSLSDQWKKASRNSASLSTWGLPKTQDFSLSSIPFSMNFVKLPLQSKEDAIDNF